MQTRYCGSEYIAEVSSTLHSPDSTVSIRSKVLISAPGEMCVGGSCDIRFFLNAIDGFSIFNKPLFRRRGLRYVRFFVNDCLLYPIVLVVGSSVFCRSSDHSAFRVKSSNDTS